jgi:hypothetical protein
MMVGTYGIQYICVCVKKYLRHRMGRLFAIMWNLGTRRQALCNSERELIEGFTVP